MRKVNYLLNEASTIFFGILFFHFIYYYNVNTNIYKIK